MLANIFCWVFAIGILISKHGSQAELYYDMIFALAFILVGTFSKAVDTYREVNKGRYETQIFKKVEAEDESVAE